MNEVCRKAEEAFLDSCRARGLLDATTRRKHRELARFFSWLSGEGKDLRELAHGDLERYMLFMEESGLFPSTINTARSMLKDLFLVLHNRHLVMTNPFLLTEISIREQAGIKPVFTREEMETFLESIDTKSGYGLRDRALFELMYGTGMRIGEAANLKISDVDINSGEIFIRQGKNRKDRIVPLGRAASKYLSVWITRARRWYALDESGPVFVTGEGKSLCLSGVRARFKKHLLESGIENRGFTVHSLRHSCATHLLENGADIRYVQELLGHESLDTTAEYTRQVETGLARLQKQFHPRENGIFPEQLP